MIMFKQPTDGLELWELEEWGPDEWAEQAAAEIAFAKAMNVQYVPEYNNLHGSVVGYRVRRAPGGLVLVPLDNDEDIFVGVRVEITKRQACVLGWLCGSEGKLPQFDQNSHWSIRPEALHDVEELPGKKRLRGMPPYALATRSPAPPQPSMQSHKSPPRDTHKTLKT